MKFGTGHNGWVDRGGTAAVPGRPRGRAWHAAFGAVAGLAATVCTAAALFVVYGAISSITDTAGDGWAEMAEGMFWLTVFGTGATAVVAGGPSAVIGAVVGGVIGSRPIRSGTAVAVAVVAAVVAAGLMLTVQRAVVAAENGQQSGRRVAAGAQLDPALSPVPAAVGAGAGGVTGVAFVLLYTRLRAHPAARRSPADLPDRSR